MLPPITFYQIVVIGSGPGGAEAALLAAKRGVPRVLLIEKDSIGGGGLRGGIIPVRSLMLSQRQLRRSRHNLGHGRHQAEDCKPGTDTAVEEGRLSDWINQQRHIVARHSFQLEQDLQQAGVEIVRGKARLLGGGRLLIFDTHPVDGPAREIQADHIILATGAKPGTPDFAEDASGRKPDVGTSRRFVGLAEAPRSLVIVGGGHIGCEFAAIYNGLGAQVTLIEKYKRLLPEMDREAGERLHSELTARGTDVRLNQEARAERSTGAGGWQLVRLLPGNEELAAEKVLLASGRVPNVTGLGLEEAGVHFDPAHGIEVNRYLETSAAGISAVGDVNGLCTLADSARAQARIAVENALGCRLPFDPGEMPRCIHTDPAVAAVGLSEDQAHAVGRSIRAASAVFRSSAPATEAAGLVKLVADATSHRLLGGMIVAERAPEWIGELSVALQLEAQAETFARVPRASDGFAEAVRTCAQKMFPSGQARGGWRVDGSHTPTFPI